MPAPYTAKKTQGQRQDRRRGERDPDGAQRRDHAGGHVGALLAEGLDDLGDRRGHQEHGARADHREHDLVVGAAEHVASVVDLEGLQGEHAGQHEQGADAEQDERPVVPDRADALLQAHRAVSRSTVSREVLNANR
jgi:hypothetical protein